MLLLFRIAEDKERLLTVVRMDIQEIQSRQWNNVNLGLQSNISEYGQE